MKFLSSFLLLLLLCLPSALVRGQCGMDATIVNEGGAIPNCYLDTVGIPTIGIGFNLYRSDAASILRRYNLDASAIINDCVRGVKTARMTTTQARDIFSRYDYPDAVECASKYSPNQPTLVAAALADMAFNLGCAGLNKFKIMQARLAAKDYAGAAAAATNSKWCGQVGTRCGKDTRCLASGRLSADELEDEQDMLAPYPDDHPLLKAYREAEPWNGTQNEIETQKQTEEAKQPEKQEQDEDDDEDDQEADKRRQRHLSQSDDDEGEEEDEEAADDEEEADEFDPFEEE